MYEIRNFIELTEKGIRCLLCPNFCIIPENSSGICGVRINKNSRLYLTTYGKTASLAIDPIEKKPLYHFLPGSRILSTGSVGCNLKCIFCQNFNISQNHSVSGLYDISPEELLSKAKKTENNCGIAFTYNEPVINYEFVYDTAELLKKNKLTSVLVSNGLINSDPLKQICRYIDAANIDLKSIKNDFYKKHCKAGNVNTVLDTIKILYEHGTIVEITNLIVTELNDSFDELKELVNAVSSISKKIPLHFSRYYPNYKYDAPPTDIKLMYKIYEYAKSELDYVYLGNIQSDKTSNTYCPGCLKLIIERNGYNVDNRIINSECPYCKTKIYGTFF